MEGFMLLLHDRTTQQGDLSPEEIQGIIAEYVAWRDKIAEQGRLLGGEKLADDDGRHLVLDDGAIRVTDGPYTEAKEVLGGYFAIKAADYDEAVEISKDCPHLKYGGRIELRKIDNHR
ncbi:MAG: hypothetical protein J5I65_03580 [Aridibacter famidurans]|nr:hypothetical protein [Aridibacter famidurans]